ncbi:FecR domain-containing protein [Planctomycetota bacterium]
MADHNKETLIELFVDDSLSKEQAQELLSLIRDDAEFKREFAQSLRIKGLIESLDSADGSMDAVETIVMNALGPAETKNRFESRIMKRLGTKKISRKKWWMPLAAALAACLVIAAGAYLYNLHQMSQIPGLIKAKFTEVQGDVNIERGEKSLPARKGMEIISGDSIKTGNDGKASVKYRGEKSTVDISEKSQLEFQEQNGAKRIQLHKGVINCSIAPQPEEKSIKLSTPHAEAEVIGTSFKLTVQENLSRLDVFKGRIRFAEKTEGLEETASSGQYIIAGLGVLMGPVPVQMHDVSAIDYTFCWTIGKKGLWTVNPTQKGLYIKQDNPESELAGIMFGKPAFTKGTLTGHIRVNSYSKTVNLSKDPHTPFYGICWGHLDPTRINKFVEISFKNIVLVKEEWHAFEISFELKESETLGRYMRLEWKDFIRLSDGGRIRPRINGNQYVDVKAQAPKYNIGFFTNKVATEWRNLKLEIKE